MADHQEPEYDMQESVEDLNVEPTHDSSSLFVPEYTPVPQNATTPPLTRSPIPTPSVTPARQPISATKPSFYQRIRTIQKKAQARKTAYQNLSAAPAAPAGSPSAEGLDSEEMDHRHALIEFQRQKEHFDNICAQHNGHLPFRQEVEWAKIRGSEDARLKKRMRDRVKKQEGVLMDEELFPTLGIQPEGGDEEDDEDDGGLWVEGSARKKRRVEQPHRQAKPVSMQEAEIRAMRVALEASSDVAKKRRKGAASLEDDDGEAHAAPPKSKPSRSKASKPSRGKAARTSAARGGIRKTAKNKRELEHATRQATSLFSANVFQEQAGMGAADQPVFQTRRKADLLKELITSIPTGEQSVGRNDMNVLLRASRDFDGTASCKIAEHGNWLVRGMKTSLKGYQMLGSAFMRRRENDTHEPKGGLMADQMGLGKTLMMLANIVNSRDAQERLKDRGPKTTLLVASPSLLTQWTSEIKQHTDTAKYPLKVMKYGAGARVDSTIAEAVLRGHDIVLATYNEVMRSYPRNVPPIELQTARQKTDWWEKTYQEKRGMLHRMFFKRIVLDEAQQIKNHQGRISIACRALMAEHKWALSGTPILNGLEELYAYFKFLGVPQTASFKIFKENYCGSGRGENAERLLARLSQFMIRRTHADRMFNAPILKLPQAIQITHWCEFNPVERNIYNIVHKRFALNINNISRNDALAKSYNNILTMLLRLRQLAAHPLMLQFVMRDLLEREDIEMIKDVVRDQAAAANVAHGRTILAIRKQLEAHEGWEKQKAADKAKRRFAAQEAAKESAKANGTEYVEPEDDFEANETDDDDAPFKLPRDGELDGGAFSDRGRERNKSGKSFGKTYDFKPYLNSLAQGEDWQKKKERAKCGECGRHPTKPWTTSCGHLICDTCYEDVMATAAEEGRANGKCKACGTIFAACARCDEEDDDMPGPSSGTRNKAQQQRREKREKERLDREDVADDWLSLGGLEVLPSAKTLAIKSQILNWSLENSNVKIIIYTQFLAMISILKKMCQQEGWVSEEYHGKMSLVARDKAIKRFADDDNSRVLLASLRCGGLGLNLTMASKVVIVDPWWNQASEQQAFCRVFRIGQQDETFLSRMCVRNTVDERLIEMQNRKQKEIDNVMEDRGKTAKSLDIADLMRLFGNIEEGDDGRPFIVVENAPPVGGFHADRDHEGYADDL